MIEFLKKLSPFLKRLTHFLKKLTYLFKEKITSKGDFSCSIQNKFVPLPAETINRFYDTSPQI